MRIPPASTTIRHFAANGGDWNLDLRTGNWNTAPVSLEDVRLPASRGLIRSFSVSPSLTGKTSLRYELSEAALVTLTLLGSDGKLLGVLERGQKAAGAHLLAWNGAAKNGARHGAAMPLLRLQAGRSTVSVPAPLLQSR